MDSQKQQVLERIKQANNILVTVSANPSVDQLAACLGLTIMLNELGKHATAVYSGATPSTIEFLQPEKTLEKNTDSLRDFIIALDKSKADKLRYKVEDKVVKIFITPYRTSINEKDLEFSQGDFNVEVVIALGVHDQQALDQAITAHGRILHDATVMSINTTAGNNLGTINWQDTKASSLAEMVTSLSENFDKKVLDNQVATALLTGIVAETDRFSNNRTTPETMKASAMLMAAGANQQLVATKLQEPVAPPQPLPAAPDQANGAQNAAEPPKSNDGTLQIEHEPGEEQQEEKKEEQPAPAPEPPKEEEKKDDKGPQIHIDESGQLHQINPLNTDREFLAGPGPGENAGSLGLPGADDDEEQPSGAPADNSKFVFNPPALGGTLTANSQPEGLDPATDPLSAAAGHEPILSHNSGAATPLGGASGPLVIEPPKHDDDDGKKPKKKPADEDKAGKEKEEDETPSTTEIPSVTLPEPKLDVVSPTVEPIDNPAPTEPQDNNPVQPLLQPAEESHNDTGADNAPLSPTPDLDSARDAVMSAIGESGPSGPANNPIAALNAQPLGGPLHQVEAPQQADNGDLIMPQVHDLGAASAPAADQPLLNPNFNEQAPGADSPSDTPLDMPLPPTLTPPPANSTPPTSSDNDDPSAPPPVPPPMMPFPSSGQ